MNNRFKMIAFKMIASSYLFLLKDGRILLSLRSQTGYEDGNYSLPAGHVEDGETLIGCLIREAKEEIGIDIDKNDISLVYVMHRKETDIRMDFFFTTTKWAGTPTNCEPQKCDDLSWFALNALPENTVGYIRAAIEGWRKGEIYQERGWD